MATNWQDDDTVMLICPHCGKEIEGHAEGAEAQWCACGEGFHPECFERHVVKCEDAQDAGAAGD